MEKDSTATCVLCQHPERAKIEHDVVKGEISKSLVAEEINMTTEEVFEHFNNHYANIKPKYKYKKHDEDDEDLETIYAKRGVMFDVIIGLKDRLDELLTIDGLTPPDTNQIVKTAAELRKHVETLAKLEGELDSGHQVTVKMYLSLKSVVLAATVSCPICKQKILDGLEEAEKDAVKTFKIDATEEGVMTSEIQGRRRDTTEGDLLNK